ncbi:TonB family protein [Methylocapsa acidiphila]|uniref:TonB family protein n=1 Tax=Methylocapsa acidiphila TaxID=133552 RepID=UPI00041E204E|nr:TonB family protein [Methylocapsa acidiphila]
MASMPGSPDKSNGPAPDRGLYRLVEPADEGTAAARADGRLVLAIVAASFLIHGLVFWALLGFDRAPDAVPSAREIPVELLAEAETQGRPRSDAKGTGEQKPPAATAATHDQRGSEAKKAEDQASKADAAQAKQAETKPVEPKAAEPKSPESKSPEPKTAETKVAEPSTPQVAAKTAEARKDAEAEKKVASKPAKARGGAQQAGAALSDKHSLKPAPGAAPSSPASTGREQAGLALPYDLGPTIFRAVAVPLPTQGGDEAMSYKVIVFGMLERAKHYPQAAIDRHARGVSVVGFSVDEAGEAMNVSLLRSSGEADLDEESVALVRRAAPFPAPPAGAQRFFAAQIDFGIGEERAEPQPNSQSKPPEADSNPE